MTPSHPNNSIEVEQPAQDAPDLPPVGPETSAPARDEPSTEVNQPLVDPDEEPERLEDPQSDPTEPEVGEGEHADAFPTEQDLISDDTLDRPV